MTENTVAKKNYNLAITTRQARVCINALEREMERLTKLYETAEGEMKELVGEKGETIAAVLESLKTRLEAKDNE